MKLRIYPKTHTCEVLEPMSEEDWRMWTEIQCKHVYNAVTQAILEKRRASTEKARKETTT